MLKSLRDTENFDFMRRTQIVRDMIMVELLHARKGVHRCSALLAALLLVGAIPCSVYAAEYLVDMPWFPKLLSAEFTGIYQAMPDFRSPYEGANSFRTDDGLGHNITQVYGIYLGSQVFSRLQAYLDVEMARGSGVSKGVGLGGYVNGIVIKTGTVDLGKGPYLARFYLRYLYPLSSETAKVERAMDQLPGEEPVSRWELKVGKMSPSDDFDVNRYANTPRTEFLNYAFILPSRKLMQLSPPSNKISAGSLTAIWTSVRISIFCVQKKEEVVLYRMLRRPT